MVNGYTCCHVGWMIILLHSEGTLKTIDNSSFCRLNFSSFLSIV